MAPTVRWVSADWPVTFGDGVALLNESVTQWREKVLCFSASLSATKRRRHHGSGRGLNALVVVVHVGDGLGLFEEIEPVAAPFINTQQY